MTKVNYQRFAIVTVTDTNYLVGTQVLFYSFLKNNSWFEGDIIVIENDLTTIEKQSLSQFPNIKFISPSKVLLERIKMLGHFWKPAQENPKQFYSIEAFDLKGYDKILFFDSDMLCIGDIKPLFSNNKAPILAAADSLVSRNELREKSSFLPRIKAFFQKGNEYFTSFNSGLLLINTLLLSPTTYQDLVNMINPMVFQYNNTRHTDQYILNMYFYKIVQIISFDYNYLLNISAHLSISDLNNNHPPIKVIHYLEYTKPWKSNQSNDIFLNIWQQYYLNFKQEETKTNINEK
jgi:UDP-glucose:(glucosyl)LPS alpha-1,3-glucosyltransferase